MAHDLCQVTVRTVRGESERQVYRVAVPPGDLRAVHDPFFDKRVMEPDTRALSYQPPGDVRGRGFPLVLDVRLVGHAQEQHRRAIQRLRVLVEKLRGPGHDIGGHPGVDLLGQLDERERVGQRALDLVRQVIRVNRDAVPADPGTWVERLEAERLSRRAPDRVPKIDTHLMADDRHLVDERDVYVTDGGLHS